MIKLQNTLDSSGDHFACRSEFDHRGKHHKKKAEDSVIGQTEKTYLKNLTDYNKLLAQRNALLKFFAQNRTFDGDTLAIYNHQMSELAHPIFEKRNS